MPEAMTAPTVHRRAQLPARRVPVVVVVVVVALELSHGWMRRERRGRAGRSRVPLLR